MLCGTMPVMAQNTKDNHNKAVFQSTDGNTEMNTDDIQVIRFDGGKVTVVQPWGETVFDRTLRNLTFFRPLPGTLRVTVDANINTEETDGVSNRALDIDVDGWLTATWKEGDQVYVYADAETTTSIGTLTPETKGSSSTSLVGDINATGLTDGQMLYLETKPRTFSFATQTGILSDLFYAKATATVSINGGNATIGNASFARPMAIVKFTLKKKDVSGNPTFNADALRVTDGTTTVVINNIPSATYTTNGDGALYVALPGFSGRDVTVEAYSGSILYAYTKSNVSFADSKYYNISIKMSPATNVNLANVFRDITLTNGCTVTGTLANILKVSIADGATVTLDDVTINGAYHDTYYKWAGINCEGDATIILRGTNNVKGFNYNFPGICVPENYTLTIQGDGSLNASSNGYGAGIGGGYNVICGNIKIEGGNITANGGAYAAGIGGGTSGSSGKCGNIEISGGTINANGGVGAAGIGAGSNSRCGNITISGGNITAQGGIYAAGIGSSAGTSTSTSGNVGVCQDITITGGTIDATGGNASAGLGGGKVCGNITISDANITARKGDGAPYSVGAGKDGICGTVTINNVVGPISTSPYTTSVSDLSAVGNANTYIVSSAGIYKFDATVKGNGGFDPLTGTTATKIDKSSIVGVKVLWEVYGQGRAIKHDGTKYDIHYNDGYVYFSTPDEFTDGDCYVAVYDSDNNILWSWLIWATPAPSEATGENGTIYMDRNLGAITNVGDYYQRGFLYQWGRKDPFSAANGSDNTAYNFVPASGVFYTTDSKHDVAYTIKNPTTYIYTGSNWLSSDAYTYNNNSGSSLWKDNEKTIYDPCPIGWRVPSSTMIANVTKVVTLPTTGWARGSMYFGNWEYGYYETSTNDSESNAYGSRNTNACVSWPKSEGYAIRPVKE